MLGDFLSDIGYHGTEKQEKEKERQWENKTPLQDTFNVAILS